MKIRVSLVSVVIALSACKPGDPKKDESTTNAGGTAGDDSGKTEGEDKTDTDTGSKTDTDTDTDDGLGGNKIAIVGTVGISFGTADLSAAAFPVSRDGVRDADLGQAISAPIQAGKVALGIPTGNQAASLFEGEGECGNDCSPGGQGGNGDWLVAIVDKSKEPIKQIVGVLGLDAGGGDSMIKLPVGKVTGKELDFGDVTLTDDVVSSTGTLSEAAKSIDLQLGMLKEIASTDNVLAGFKNVFANSRDGKTYAIKPFFIYKGVQTNTVGQFTNPADIKGKPDNAGQNGDFGYGFYFDVNDPMTAKFDDICPPNGSDPITLLSFVPPSDLEKNSVTYNEANPLTNASPIVTMQGSNRECSANEFYANGAPHQDDYSFNFGGGGYTGSILPGIWRLYARVLIELNQLEAAMRALSLARKLKMPAVEVWALMGHIAYLQRDFEAVRACAAELPADQLLPPSVAATAAYWRHKRIGKVDVHV